MTVLTVTYPVPSVTDEEFCATPRFTLGEFVADPFNPYRGNEAETREMLKRYGWGFVDSMHVRGSWDEPLPEAKQ